MIALRPMPPAAPFLNRFPDDDPGQHGQTDVFHDRHGGWVGSGLGSRRRGRRLGRRVAFGRMALPDNSITQQTMRAAEDFA
jgi:hypothetical protein